LDTSSNTQKTLTEHWNGTRWSVIPSPNVGTNGSRLFAVAAASSTDVWAVGDYLGSNYQTLTEHWNGTSWSVIPSPNCSTGAYANFLSGVTAISQPPIWGGGTVVSWSDAWVVGSCLNPSVGDYVTLAEHWSPRTNSWVIQPSLNIGFSPGFLAASELAPNDVWAVGSYTDPSGSPDDTLTEHWNGSAWSIMSSPNVGTNENFLDSVAAISTNNVWAVGYQNSCTNFPTCPPQGLVEHWNGTTWAVVASPDVAGLQNSLVAVTATATGEAWAAGSTYNYATQQSQTLVEHWNGTAWAIATTASIGGFNSRFVGVGALSASDVWAVGNFESTSSSPYQTLVERYH
jgi:hypothetical protein